MTTSRISSEEKEPDCPCGAKDWDAVGRCQHCGILGNPIKTDYGRDIEDITAEDIASMTVEEWTVARKSIKREVIAKI